ncbi:hypothetical protein S40293_06631 [Stachybotrys chartarum IBT 40293]|nr:hypothetical protein S40293_06631 [Stachybotrys chartarum IBT 40293]
MANVSLSQHDINVLEKIKDPESDPTAAVVIDASLPRDPYITDDALYEQVVGKERDIIRSIQQLETQLNETQSLNNDEVAIRGYQYCIAQLDHLISDHPNYASARNNRAQALRRLYGDAMLLSQTTDMPMPLVAQPESSERRKAAATALGDLERSIVLLSPPSPKTPLSPQVVRTLSMAHTQRAAIYLKTSKMLVHRSLDVDNVRPEAQWTRLTFEEAASQDLAMGGRYGNEIAKGLAVSVNPTAKLCGEMVREAMKKEYGQNFDI